MLGATNVVDYGRASFPRSASDAPWVQVANQDDLSLMAAMQETYNMPDRTMPSYISL